MSCCIPTLGNAGAKSAGKIEPGCSTRRRDRSTASRPADAVRLQSAVRRHVPVQRSTLDTRRERGDGARRQEGDDRNGPL
jgi:hypothetical protein